MKRRPSALIVALILLAQQLPAQTVSPKVSGDVGSVSINGGQAGAQVNTVPGGLAQPLGAAAITPTLGKTLPNLSLPSAGAAPSQLHAGAQAVSPSIALAPTAIPAARQTPAAAAPRKQEPAAKLSEKEAPLPEVGPAGPVAEVAGRPAKPQGIEELEPNKPGLGTRVRARIRKALGWDGGQPVDDPLIGEKIDVTPWLKDMLQSNDPEVSDRLLAIFPQLWDKPLDEPADAPKTLAEVSLEPESGRKYAASPEDWRDEVFYSIFVDRFARGGEAKPWGDPQSGQTWHGGNIQGVIDKLDYMKGMGVTTIMLTSLVMSAPGGYHGYWPVHMMAVDPHYGSMADYKKLVAEAHKRGMRVVMDLAVNHVGKVFTYEDNNHWGGIRKVVNWLRRFKPLDLAKEEHFYRRGVIADWNDPDQALRGDFPPDLRHFNVENKATQDLLIKMAKWWIKETDIDGFRLDAYRHMHPSFWARFHHEIRGYAAGLGKKNFLQLGELSVGLESDLVGHMGPGKLDSAFSYPAYRRDNAALHGRDATRMLEVSFWEAAAKLGEAADRLLRFIDNHDTYRFMREGTPMPVFKLALAYLLFSTGIPMVYAGTEQAVRQAVETMAPENPSLPADPHNREDLFAGGGFKSRFTQGDVLQAGTASYEQFKRLADLRKKHAALRRGAQYVRWSDPNGAGIFAFSRILDGQEVVVVINTSGDTRSADMWVDGVVTPAGTPLADELDPGYSPKTYQPDGGGSKLHVDVPPHAVRVLIKRKA